MFLNKEKNIKIMKDKIPKMSVAQFLNQSNKSVARA